MVSCATKTTIPEKDIQVPTTIRVEAESLSTAVGKPVRLSWYILATKLIEDLRITSFPDGPKGMVKGDVSKTRKISFQKVQEGKIGFNRGLLYDAEFKSEISGKFEVRPIVVKTVEIDPSEISLPDESRKKETKETASDSLWITVTK